MRKLTTRTVVATGALLTLLGCASTYDRDLADRRRASLYGGELAERSPESDTESATDSPTHDPAAALLADPDLETYLEFGLRNSADLRAAYEDWRAAAERIEQTSTLPDPKLSYGEFLEEVQTRTGPQERRFGLSQAFPWPGQLSKQASVAERRAEASWQRVESERLRVAAEIEVAFQEYAFLGRERRITEELLGLLRGLEPVVQSQVVAGRGQEDILRLQVEIGRLEDDLESILRRRPALSARLADSMHLQQAPGETLPLPELVEPETRTIDVRRASAQALERNPRLLELFEQVEAGREAEDLASYRRKPRFAVGVDYIQTGEAVNPSLSGSGDDPLLVGLSLSLPIWTSSYAAFEREARHAVRAAQQRLDSLRSTLKSRVEEEAYRIDDATRRIVLYRESLIPRAEESLELTLGSYRAGKASILDLIDSERALLEFELSLWRACRAYLQGDARLRALTAGAEQ